MQTYPYLIIGGGMAAHAAALAIRGADKSGLIGMISAEATGPYKRPPLSKGLWRDEPLESIWLDTRIPGLELVTKRRVVSIRRADRTVVDDQGAEYGYAKLLLATGGEPRTLGSGNGQVIYFRTVDDYRKLRALADGGARVAVIGGGFIGSEVAAALAMNGLKPTLIFPEATIGARVFPRDLGLHLNRLFQVKGVRVLPGESVTRIETKAGGRSLLSTSGGSTLEVDAVVAGVGIRPSTGLAAAAGLKVDDGIVVGEGLRTSDPFIFAAGDVARFPNPVAGGFLRVEHEDASISMGAAAGQAMAGVPTTYRHLPFFYSDLFELGYEAVGTTDPRLEVVTDWTNVNERGFIYYLSDGRVRGVVCWGIFGRMPEARALLAEPGPHLAADLRGRLRP